MCGIGTEGALFETVFVNKRGSQVAKELIKPIIYNRIFGRDKDGKAILEELNRIYYNRPSFMPGDDPLTAAYKEGQRSVIALLNRKTNKEEEG